MRMRGLLTVADVEQFARDRDAAVRSIGLSSGKYLLLIETEGDQVQTQEVVGAFQLLMREGNMHARRIATVRHGALSSLQSRRIAQARGGSAVFSNLEEAEKWLFDPDGTDEHGGEH